MRTGDRGIKTLALLLLASIGTGSIGAEPPADQRSPDRLIVKFDESARVRLRAGEPVSLVGQSLGDLKRTVSLYADYHLKPLIGRSELDADRPTRTRSPSRETESAGRRRNDLPGIAAGPAADRRPPTDARRRGVAVLPRPGPDRYRCAVRVDAARWAG